MQHIYGDDLHEAIHHYTQASVALTAHLEPDVIHCHDWMTYEAGIRASAHHRVPLVAHIHATELDRTHFQPHQWIYDQERRGFEMADHIIAVSQYTREMLVREYGIAPDKISVVHNSADLLLHDAAPAVITTAQKQHPLVLFLGRLTIQKGPMQFLEMAQNIHRLRPDVQFVMAGDGAMLPELINRACALGLETSVSFAGKVSKSEGAALYRQADCFVMPSLSEPFGIVALEAIAQGTPVVLSKQSGAGEVIGHCFKVDFWDTELMADCVLTILREQPLAEQLKSEAPRILQHLTWKNQAHIVQSLYERLSPPRA
jgi:glycosyltransferase involved in cell wall biosynthesis